MLLKLAKALALVALGVMLLHAMPAFCQENNQIALGSAMTSSDGCVSGDACCVNSSFVQSTPDFALGQLDLLSRSTVLHRAVTFRQLSEPLSDAPPHTDPDLSALGKLNI